MPKTGKKILIIGGGWEQVPLIKKAKEKGLYVITTYPYPRAEGFAFADENQVISPRDLQGLEKLFDRVKPAAVIADECDYSMFAVAFLSARHGLPGPDMDALSITNNKFLQRKIARRAGISQPDFELCMTFKDVRNAAERLGFPVMLKPLDNRGGFGVLRVEKKSDLRSNYLETIINTYSRQLLVEKVIPGSVVTVDGIYTDKFYNLTFSTKKMHPKFIENAMHLQFPGDLPKVLVDKLFAANQRLIKEFGINYGLTHSEFMVNKEDISFIEAANRGGGVHISNLIIPSITGIDTSGILIDAAFGKTASLDKFSPAQVKKVSFLHFFDFGKGRVISIRNFNRSGKTEGVLCVRLFFKVGDYLGDIRSAVNRPGFVIVTGDNINDCENKLKEVYRKLDVRLQPGAENKRR